MTFEVDISVLAEKYADEFDERVRALCLQLTESVVKRTPVDTGRLKGNWQATIGSPASAELETSIKDNDRVTENANDAIRRAPGQVFYLTNNLPYAEVAEYGKWSQGPNSTDKTTSKGYSKQAPAGMVRLTIAEIRRAIRSL